MAILHPVQGLFRRRRVAATPMESWPQFRGSRISGIERRHGESEAKAATARGDDVIRAPKDAGAGLLLIAIGAIAAWQSAGLTAGTLRQIGPGMLPRFLAAATVLLGLALLLSAFRNTGERLAAFSVRGPVLVLGAAVLFGFAVRPLGVAVATPLTLILSTLASPETRWREALIFCAAMTAFCLLLFKALLGLPIPIAPWLIGY